MNEKERPKKFIVEAGSDHIFDVLQQGGVFEDDPRLVRRVVIDLEAGRAARIYVERLADTRLVDVLLRGGIDLVEREREPEEPEP
jgi:hypothetical protein